MNTRAIFGDIVSPFHLISALAAAAELGVQEVDIYLLPNLDGRYLLPQSSFTTGGMSVHLRHQPEDLRPVGGAGAVAFALARSVVFLVGRAVMSGRGHHDTVWLGHHTYFKPSMLRYLPLVSCFNVGTISFEEGVGSYGGARHHRMAAKMDGKAFPGFKYWLRRILMSGLFVDRRWEALQSGGGEEFTVACSTLAETFYSAQIEAMRRTVDDRAGTKNSVLFFTSPVTRGGLVSVGDYSDCISRIKDFFGDTAILVKPHPLDNERAVYEKAGMIVLQGDVPGELVVSGLRPTKVAGFTSGMLILAARILGRDSLLLNDFLPADARGSLEPSGMVAELFAATSIRVAPSEVGQSER